ncbi:hypothetical protein ACXJJ3_32795 [Kribbella sp. WER1]
MAKPDFKLDKIGPQEILLSGAVGAEITRLAQAVAANADVPSYAEVVVDEYTTDREAASVTIRHPAGVAIQAKYGSLTRAASAVGLEVNEK